MSRSGVDSWLVEVLVSARGYKARLNIGNLAGTSYIMCTLATGGAGKIHRCLVARGELVANGRVEFDAGSSRDSRLLNQSTYGLPGLLNKTSHPSVTALAYRCDLSQAQVRTDVPTCCPWVTGMDWHCPLLDLRAIANIEHDINDSIS